MSRDDELTRPTADRDELRRLLGMEQRARPAVLLDGQMIGEAYRIERELGAGGMGVVYLARDVRLSRDVAIKVHAAVAGERLLREAAALAQLVHPHVVTVHEIGSWNDHPYVVMEYVPGGTARTWRAAAPRRTRAIVELYLAAGRGLAAAHAGLVHRDFKPDNVLVGDDGRVRVADFGLARAHGEVVSGAGDALGGDVTATGTVMGTPAYMAPEQREGGAVGPAADQYAFAVALWEAIEGARPATPPAPPKKMSRAVSRALTRALAVDPTARWPSMNALLARLARAAAPSRVPIAVGVGVLAIAGVTAAIVWTRTSSGPAPCTGATREFDGVWDAPARDAARAALGARYDAIGQRVDAYAAELTAQRLETCRSSEVRHEQTPATRALRDHCLDQRRARLRAVAGVLATPELAAHGLDEVLTLDDPAACSDVARLSETMPLPDDPWMRAQITAVDAQLVQAQVLFTAGRIAEVRALATAAIAEAIAIGYPAQKASARALLAELQMRDGDPAARTTIEQGLSDAAVARDDMATVDLWNLRLRLEVDVRNDFVQADRLAPLADAALVRAGDPVVNRLNFLVLVGWLRLREHRYADARVPLEEARGLAERTFGPDDPRVAVPLEPLALTLQHLDDSATATADMQRAVDLFERAYSPDDEHLVRLRGNQANLLTDQGRFADALAAQQQVLAAQERGLGSTHVDLVFTLEAVCQLLVQLDRAAEAMPLSARVLAIAEKAPSIAPDQLAHAVANRADVLAADGELDEARITFDRAIAIDAKALAADDPALGNLYARRADLLLDDVDVPSGRADLARAQQIAGLHPEDADLAHLVSHLVTIANKPRP